MTEEEALKVARMGRKKIQIARIMDERNRHVSKRFVRKCVGRSDIGSRNIEAIHIGPW